MQAVALDGLRNLLGVDVFGALQVGYGAGDFEDAGIGLAARVENPTVSQLAVS
jgi:hypothetical protein